MALTIGQQYVSPKSGFTGTIAEIVPATHGLVRVRLVSDTAEKWSMVKVA
jgi:hypothetical protein